MHNLPDGYEFSKEVHNYYLKYNGEVVSHLALHEFDDFSWMLITDVDTEKDHRRKGCASFLIEQASYEARSQNKGIYLMVKCDNSYAVHFYTNLGFENLRTCKIKDEDYFIFVKGSSNIEELLKVKFTT